MRLSASTLYFRGTAGPPAGFNRRSHCQFARRIIDLSLMSWLRKPIESKQPSCCFATALALLACVAVVITLWPLAATARSPQAAAHAERPGAGTTIDVPWLIASEDQPWTVALAAPVAAHLRNSGPSPLVMALASPPTPGGRMVARPDSGPAADRAGHIRSVETRRHAGKAIAGVAANRQRSQPGQRDGGEAVLEPVRAKSSWRMADDPEAVILGSALAASLGVPILLCEQDEAGAAVSAALEGPVGRADAGCGERCRRNRPAGSSSAKSPPRSCRPRHCSTG